jgi:membrane protease subunit HflC
MKTKGILGILALIALGLYSAAFVVDETEQVVITRFGKVVREPIREPGLYFKLPYVDTANDFPKNLQSWDGDPGQVPTLDKTFILVDTFARWKIVDPLKFLQNVVNVQGAKNRLNDIIQSAVRNLVTSYPLIETVRMTNRELDTIEPGLDQVKDTSPIGQVKLGRVMITKAIIEQAQPKLDDFGIELVDVKFKLLNYVEEVQKSVYGRMIGERKQIAEKFRSEGKGEARKIEGEMERDLKLGSKPIERPRSQEKLTGHEDLCSILWQRSEFLSFVRRWTCTKTMDKKLAHSFDQLRFRNTSGDKGRNKLCNNRNGRVQW